MTQVETQDSRIFSRLSVWLAILVSAIMLSACSSTNLPAPPTSAAQNPEYRIGAGDSLDVFVWQNKDLSAQVAVRPDGMISLPLVNDIKAEGTTPTQLAGEIQDQLKKFVTNPVVTVMVSSFVGPYSQQIRIVGEAAKPQALPYRTNMTVLDAMIAVGGLTQYAAGDRATLVRTTGGEKKSYRLRLDALLQDGDISANAPLEPGDVIIIPQTYF